jgi:hypothetical protein
MAVRLTALCAGRNFTPWKIPGTHFCLRLSRPQGHSAAGRIKSTEKSYDLIGNRIRDLPACSIVPQPTTLARAPFRSEFPIKILYPFLISTMHATFSAHLNSEKSTNYDASHDVILSPSSTSSHSLLSVISNILSDTLNPTLPFLRRMVVRGVV